jgi:uncharacterized protein involved in exopolysaccharide biosynthesis
MLQNNSSENNLNQMDEINLLDYMYILVKHRWTIVRNFSLTIGISIIISLILPAKYTAITTLMPPQEQDHFSMTSLLSDVTVPGFNLPTNTSPSEILVEILNSKSVGERVLNRLYSFKKDSCHLFEILDYDSLELALLHIEDFAHFEANEQGIISVTVELKDRILAADVANAFVEELDRIKQEKSVSRAKNSRIYIEYQLHKTEEKLQNAAKELASFQKENKAISLETQLETSIKQAGELKGKIIAKEVQLGVMKQTMKSENPMIIQAQNELNELYKLYREIQFGTINPVDQNDEFYLPFANMPDIGYHLAKLIREVKVQETVWQLLNQQYHQAKIEEARNTPTVQVLDHATPPVLRSSPKRKLIVISFGFIALLFSVLWCFGKEFFERLHSNPDHKQKIDSFYQIWKQDKARVLSKLQKQK